MMDLDAELLTAAVARLPGDGLRPVRESALARFSETGFPTLKHEDWRYTNLAAIADLSRRWLETGEPVRERGSQPVPDDIDADWIVLSDENLATLPAAVAGIPGLHVARLSDSIAGAHIVADDGISSFNAALLREGLYLRIDAGASIEKPIGLMIDHAEPVGQMRVIVDVGDNARLRIIEYHDSAGADTGFSNSIVQLQLGQAAHVDYVRMQQLGPEQMQIGRLMARLERNARLHVSTFDFGGKLVRNDISADIVGTAADVRLHGLYLAGDGQHIDNHTRVDHRVGPATSDEVYRGILNGHSRCVFNGKVVVHDGADGTDANQANHNLLLSDKAEIDTKPELEIYADDVKCSHGATVGQLDDEALFYLRSRGLDREQASRALMTAFAASVMDTLPIEAIRDHVGDALMKKLDRMLDDTGKVE